MNLQGKSQRPTLHSGQLAGVGLTLSVRDLPDLELKLVAVAARTALVVVSSRWLLTSFLRH